MAGTPCKSGMYELRPTDSAVALGDSEVPDFGSLCR
jgi:hypothetical protein